jgi:hypothetical protein
VKEYMHARLGCLIMQSKRQKTGGQRPVIVRCGGWSWLVMAVVAALAVPVFAGTKQPVPESRLLLEDLGFPGISQNFLASGGSMLSVNFVDSDHLLFTYSQRGLVPRLEGDPVDDEDRVVAAKLIELPSGKVVAQTQWHLHDHSRYLWSLGHGRFMLRIAGSLSTFEPMANLAAGQPFERTAFAHRRGLLSAVLVSGDGELLTIETGQGPVMLDFYRLSDGSTVGTPLRIDEAGSVRAPSPMLLPIDADGYFRTADREHDKWAIEYKPFAGKEVALAPIDSTCSPTLRRVGTSQFVAETCRGKIGGTMLSAFDFEKHEMWEEPLAASPLPPSMAMAPEAGRFAISRVASIDSVDTFQMQPDSVATQDVRVYQTQTGNLLLKVSCSPIFRTAENFDLSEDGMRAVVVRGDAIEVYRLPALTALDRADLAELQKVAPPHGTGKIELGGLAKEERQAATSEAASVVETESVVNGDSQGPRKPPTLLKPGEKPEFGRPNPE